MSVKTRLGSEITIVAAALLLLLGGCKNPFEAGLGDKVDVNRPEITLESPQPGDFLKGVVTFTGKATDDGGVTAVRISFDSGATWSDVTEYDPVTRVWRHELDTGAPPYTNGPLKVILRVIDDSAKKADTEELVFTIDNAPPQIEIQVPAINAGYDPDDPPKVAMNGAIIGIVTDLHGVAVGYPQIKFWKDGTPEPGWDDRIGLTEAKKATDFRYRLEDDWDGQVGDFRLRVRAMDLSGDETIVPPIGSDPYKVKVTSSEVPPELSFAFTAGDVNTVSGVNYAGKSFQFRVTAQHANGIESVTLRKTREGFPAVNVPWSADDNGSPIRTLDAQIPVSTDGSEDGSYEFKIEAVSKDTGGLAELYRTIIIDTTKPSLEFTKFSPTVSDGSVPLVEYINGMVQIDAVVSDANGILGSRWWMLKTADPAPTGYDSPGGSDCSCSKPTIKLDSTALTDETDYTFYLFSRDRAGNDAVLSRKVHVRQATDLPTVTMTDIDTSITTAAAAGVGGVNLLDTNARLRGALEDDDRIDPSSVILKLNGTPVGTIDSLGPAGKSVSFSHNVDSLGQGVHRFELEFSDDPGFKEGKPKATSSIGPVYFVIDTAPPTIATTSPGAGTYQSGTFALSGTASDVNGLATITPGGSDPYIEAAFPDAPSTWVTVPVTAGNWSVTVGGGSSSLFGGSWEGPRTVSLRGRDRFGKLSTGSFAFTVDTVAPAAAVAAPGADQWLSGASASIQGTASDATSSISQVRYWVGNEGAAPPGDVNSWTAASGTTNWNSSINLSALGEGRRTLHVKASDAAGNWSAAVTRTFGIDQAAPTVTETAVGAAAASINGEFGLGGLLGDSNGLKNLKIVQTKGAGPAVEVLDTAAAGTSQAWTLGNLPRNPANPANPLLEDGIFSYGITVTDQADRTAALSRVVTVDLTGPDVTITSPTPGAVVQGTALSAGGTAADFGGVSAIAETRYYVTTPPASPPGDFSSWSPAAGGAVWSATLNFLPAEEGRRALHVRARDAAGNWSPSAATASFMVDHAAPEIQGFSFGPGTINTVGGTSYARGNFSFSFTAHDSNELANVLVTRNGTQVFSGDYSSTSQPVTVNQTVGGGAGLADGIYEYIVTVTDAAGKTSLLSRSVVVDTQGPLTEIVSLNPVVSSGGTDYVNGSIRFTASASDNNGLTGVTWWVLPAADPAPADYGAPGGTVFAAAPYTALVNTASLSDNTAYRLYVMARDRALNDSLSSRAFTVDQSTDTPVVTLTSPGAGSFVGGGYTVRGTVTDDDGVAAGTVQVRYHDGSAWSGWAPAGVAGSGRDVTFTYILPPGIGADGAKQVQARAYDDAAAKLGGDPAVLGQSSPVSFTLDSLPPVASITTPAPNSAGRTTFTVSGSVVEKNLESLRLSLDGGAFQDALVAGAGETKSWTYDLDAGDFNLLTEGPHTLAVEAVDQVGRAHTVQRVFYKDTTGPSISFSTIIEGADTIVTDPTPVIRGGFSDEYADNAAAFEYRLDSSQESDPWTTAAVTGSGRSVVWAVPVDSLSEGGHSIDIRIFDSIGNSSVRKAVAFRLDRQVPVIGVSSPAPGGLYGPVASGDVFTLTGTASDATLSKVYARLGGGSDVDITGVISGGSTSWSYTVSKAVFDPLADGQNTVTLTAVDGAGRTAQTTWAFRKDTTAPEIVFNNIEADGTTVLLEGEPKIQGGSTDAQGVFVLQSRVERYDYGASSWTQVQDWTGLGSPSGQTVTAWTKNLGSGGLNLSDGRYRITVRALDGAAPVPNEKVSAATAFRIDRANPALALNPGGLFQKADFTITGAASDANTVTAVRAKVGDADFSSGTVAYGTTSNAYAAWSLTVPTSGLSGGSHTVYIEAEDGAGRKSLLTREFSFDGVAPSVFISEPPSASRVNGLVTVRGTSSDDNAVSLVQYRVGNGAVTWQTAGLGGGLYSWSYTFPNINTYANTGDVTEIDPATGLPQSGTNVWALPFQVRVVDVAGNAAEELSYKLYVDPDMDAPEVTVISPANDQIVGGEVRVSGYASDDDWVHRVEMRVDPTGTGGSYGAWAPVTLVNQGTQVNWFKNINSSGELNPSSGSIRDVRIQVRAFDSKDYGVTEGIPGDVTELNVKFDSGVPVIENVRIYRSGEEAPYAAGVRASGTFSVRATVKDEGGIASIKWRREGQTGFTDILNNPLYTTPPAQRTAGSFETGRKYLITSVGTTNFTAIGASSNTMGISFVATGPGSGTGTAFEASGPSGSPADQHFVYGVDIQIDSTTVNSGHYAGTTGFFSLDLQATDNATPTPFLTQTNLNIQIDNYHPSGEYTSSVGASTANYYIQGRAWDSGAGSGNIQGIDRVVVYFYRNGGYISPTGGAFNGTTLLVKDMTAGGTVQTVPFPADASSGIVIDNNEVTVDLDGSGYIEGFTDDGIYKNWYVIFDTNQLADGPVDLNYVVIDRAGNATRHVQSLYIRNNAPVITGVVLGTDVNGDGTVGDITSGESRRISADYGATGFTIRNERLYFGVETSGGNAPNRFSVGYVTGTASTAASALTPGEVYTIAVPGSTNWTLLGADSNSVGTTFVATGPGTGTGTATGYAIAEKNAPPFTASSLTISDFSAIPDTGTANGARFVIRVYDSTVPAGNPEDQLATAVVMGMNIDNVDNQPPTLTAAAFGKKFSNPPSFADGDKTLQDVGSYNENIVTTGSGMSQTRHGYVQYASHSGDGDADISGKVIFLGKAWDNQRIARITATIPGYDGGNGAGAEFDIALWNGAVLAAPAGRSPADVAAGTSSWGFEAEASSQMVSEANGHVLNWKFAWDSAAVSTVTASDGTVTFTAYDAGPAGGNSAGGSLTVDIVPYITGISNPAGQGGLSGTVIRSSTGRYGMDSHGTNYFRVTGFNLSGAVAHISATPPGTQPGTTNLTVAATTATTADIRKNFSLSGYLTVFVGGIPSANNLNDPGAPYHSEASPGDPRSSLWNDDRYISMWSLTQVLPAMNNQTFYYPSMVMAGNQPIFSYANDNNGYNFRTTGDTASVQRGGVWFERHTALARNSSGSYWILSAEDAFSGNDMGYLYLNRDRAQNALTGGNGSTNTNHFEIFGLDYTTRQMNRVKYPKLIAEGPDAATNIYITYYDTHPSHRELSFVAFRATSATASNLTQPSDDSSRATQVQVIPGTAGAGSEYYDMVKIGTSEVAVAYFDEDAGNLKLKYSGNAWNINNLSGSGTWSDLMVDDSPLTGSHVSMAVGQRGGTTYLYLAYHDAAETSLKLAEINWTTKAVATVVVDNRFTVGTRTRVQVIDGIPHVAYYSDSYSGTRNAMRLAFPVAANGRTAEENITMPGADAYEQYTGNWEVAAVPTVTPAKGGIEQFNRAQLDTYTNAGANLPVVAWLGDRIEYAKLQPPAP